MANQCYICTGEEGILVRPCGTENCSARVHELCLEQQCKNNKKCGNCREEVVIIATTILNKENCFETYILRIFFTILYPLSLFFMTMGETIILVCLSRSDTQCDKNMLQGQLFYYIMSPFMSIVITICYYNTSFGDKINSSHYVKKFHQSCWSLKFCYIVLFYLVSLTLILIAHRIGYPIIKWYFEMEEFFTWRTATIGYVIYCLVGALVLLINTIYNIFLYCYDEFIVTSTKFGAVVNNQGPCTLVN